MPMEILADLLLRCPKLQSARPTIAAAYDAMASAYRAGAKLLVCGNGGSAADAEHIAGELMKGFAKRRPVPPGFGGKMHELFGDQGAGIAANLQGALPCIALTGHVGLSTAFNNDVDPALTFAQQVYGYARVGDVLLGISTSGNSRNVLAALMVARAVGVATVGLTGASGGRMPELCDVCIRVPESETFLIQELHLPIYHCLCLMLEATFFEQ